MVHHDDVEKAAKNLKKSMQYECRIVNKKEFFEKPSDTKRKDRISLKRRLKRNNRR